MFDFKKQDPQNTSATSDANENNKKDNHEVELEMRTMKSDLSKEPTRKQTMTLEKDYGDKKIPRVAAKETAPEPVKPQQPTVKSSLSSQFLNGINKKPSNLKFDKPAPTSTNPQLDKVLQSVSEEKPKFNSPENKKPEEQKPEISEKPKLSFGPDKQPPIKKSMPDFDFGKISPASKEVPTATTEQKINLPLLIGAVCVFLLAIGAGLYYYFGVVKKSSQSISTVEPPTSVTEEAVEIIDEEPVVEEVENIPLFLSNAEKLEIQASGNLIDTLKLLAGDSSEEMMSDGFYSVMILELEKDMNAKELLQALGVSLPEIDTSLLKSGWIFLNFEQDGTLRLGLALTTGATATEVSSIMMRNESVLFENIRNLYISGQPVDWSSGTTFSISTIDPIFRFFNFNDSANNSIDWGVMNLASDGSSEGSIIFVSTSKSTTEKMVSASQK